MKLNSGYPTPVIGLIKQEEAKAKISQPRPSLSVLAEKFTLSFDQMASSGSIDLKALVKLLPDLNIKKGQHWDFVVNSNTPNYLLNKEWAWMLSGTLDEDSAWQVLLWVTRLGSYSGEWASYHIITHEKCLTELRLRSAKACLDNSILDKARENWSKITVVKIDNKVRISVLAWVDGSGLQRVTFQVRKSRNQFLVETFGMVEA